MIDEGFRRPLLILGPYAAPDVAGIGQNVARAVALGQLGRVLGWAPIVPHALGWLGVYGDPTETDPIGRPTALACVRTIVAGVVRQADAACWAIVRDDGQPTEGVAAEIALWRGAGGQEPRVDTWAGWARSFDGLDLRDVYDAAIWPRAPALVTRSVAPPIVIDED